MPPLRPTIPFIGDTRPAISPVEPATTRATGPPAGTPVATGWTDVVYQRLGTFAQPGTSAHSRFVAPFELPVATVQEEGARSVFVGDGPGNVQENHNDQWNVFAKVVIEYGASSSGT